MKSSDIGKHIAALREAKGYSQKELAEVIPVTQPTLSRWESGAVIPPLQQLERVCEVLGISLEQIFAGEKKEYNRLRVKLIRFRIITVTLLTVLLLSIILLLIPKYIVVFEGEVYRGDYGETLTVYVKPVFFITETQAETYGRKITKKYQEIKDVDVIEIVFVKSADNLTDDNCFFSFLYFQSSPQY